MIQTKIIQLNVNGKLEKLVKVNKVGKNIGIRTKNKNGKIVYHETTHSILEGYYQNKYAPKKVELI
jgi:hypothetical protein